MYLREDYNVWIIGKKPNWIKNVGHIPHERASDIELPNCYDANIKLLLALSQHNISGEFMIMHDDMYFLRDTTYEDIRKPIALDKPLEGELTDEAGKWHRLVHKTCQTLDEKGYTAYSYETHLPRIYKKDIMKDVFDRFDPIENRLLFATLYYNYQDLDPKFISKDDDVRYGFYGKDDEYSFNRINSKVMNSKRYLNHADAGLDDKLKQQIIRMYPIPSPQEI